MEARVINVEKYIPEVIILTNDTKSFRKYLKRGYCVSNRTEGYCTLIGKSKVLVTIECEGIQKTINLRRALSKHYKKEQASKLIEMFKRDLQEEKVRLEMDSNGYCSIVEK